MPVEAVVYLAAFGLDAIIGDPRWLSHPVVLVGKGISGCETWLRRLFSSPAGLRWAGLILVVVILGCSYGAARLVPWLAGLVAPGLGLVVSIWILYTSIAPHDLARAGLEIYGLLQRGELETARQRLSWIVGRDTGNLDEAEIVRATVETVAENIVDAVVSPLFYFVIGGPALAFAYRAVNTMDSMLGYRNDRYRDFGMVAARLDDAANYIPARLTGLLLLAGLFLAGKPVGRAWKTMWRDAGRHPSPNSGIPEAAVAGGLGIRLGGYNSYGGIVSFRAYMGEPLNPMTREQIKQTVVIMYLVAVLAVLAGTAVLVWL